MTAEELLKLRKEMHFDKASLALILNVPYRTLQNYEAGIRKIPAEFAKRMRAAHAHDREQAAQMGARIDRELSIMYPMGIPSEIENNDHENLY